MKNRLRFHRRASGFCSSEIIHSRKSWSPLVEFCQSFPFMEQNNKSVRSGEGNKTFFIKVWKPLPISVLKPERKSLKRTISTIRLWKPLPSIRVLKILRESPNPKRTISVIWVWKPLRIIRVLKTLRENPKEKAERRQYLQAVDLGRYKKTLLWFREISPFLGYGYSLL